MDPIAGRVAVVSGVIAAVGVVFLLLFYLLFFATPLRDLGQAFGWLNDALIAIQYLLTVPLALSLRRILRPHAGAWIDAATVVGIASMLVVVVLQAALVAGVLTFAQQVVPVSMAMIVGVGLWLVSTGLVARSAKVFPHSLAFSIGAALYIGYPVWALWLGRHLLRRA